MKARRIRFRRWGLWIGGVTAMVLSGLAVLFLCPPGRTDPNAVEVEVVEVVRDGLAARIVVRQEGRGLIHLMTWRLEEESGQRWKTVTHELFSGGKPLDPDHDYTFTVQLPPETSVFRVRMQYGVGLHGTELWRQRIRWAWKTRSLKPLLEYNEWEACEGVASLGQ